MDDEITNVDTIQEGINLRKGVIHHASGSWLLYP
jgi:hypothetical protein